MTVRMRHTRSQTANRRSHHALSSPTLVKEGNSTYMRHRMNPETGTYRGRKVIDMGAKAVKRAERSREKENAR
ncbi:50S ribosomal protein L32 [Candidatus Parcubacteria bacterium]|nr:50S ribosomal protein L32 [Candidatus Parcubacteria bacterium]